MASQNEVHKESGNDQVDKDDKQAGDQSTRSTELETREKQPPPFSEFDPFRATRYRTLNSETQNFFNPLGIEATGFDGVDESELRSLQEDAEERARWSKTRQDAFSGVVRLGTAVPPRNKRLL